MAKLSRIQGIWASEGVMNFGFLFLSYFVFLTSIFRIFKAYLVIIEQIKFRVFNNIVLLVDDLALGV